MEQRTYEAGDVIFEEGQTGRVMYILVEGVVEICKKTHEGKTLLKVVNQKNEVFGEMALIDDLPRSASAVAVEPTTLYEINETSFEHLIKTNGNFAFKVIQILSERIRNSNYQISDLSEGDQKDRIQHAMVDYARLHGETIYNSGLKVNIDEMTTWINNHMGIAVKDLENHIQRLIKQDITPLAATSQKTRDAVVLSPEFMTTNERRRTNLVKTD
jgi:CRP/FNR family transcriptional regulator, cyclic AMP receptor protein